MGQKATSAGQQRAVLMTEQASRARQAWLGLWRAQWFRILLGVTAIWVVGGFAVFVSEQIWPAIGEDGSPDVQITNPGIALWYSIVTVATVGYGDYTPRGLIGRLLGTMLILVGTVATALLTGTIASILTAQRIREGRGLETIKVKDHVLLCGWNQYAERVLEGLFIANPTAEVVLVNELPEASITELLGRFDRRNLHYVNGDPAMEGTLERANIREAESAVVVADTSHAVGNASDERTTLVALNLRSLNPQINITTEVLDIKNEPHLRRAGAKDTVISGEFNGFLLSSAATAHGMSDVVRQLLSVSGNELRREPIPKEYIGRTFSELLQGLRDSDGFLTLAIVREKQGLSLDDLLTDDYSLVDQFIRTEFRDAGAEHLRSEAAAMVVTVNPPDTYVIDADDTAIGIPSVP
jgi:voltage-gated potassium channel